MQNTFGRFLVVGLLIVGVVGSSGCLPRGETKTLSEVIVIAQKRYAATSKDGLPANVAATLTGISAHLDVLVTTDDIAAAQPKVAAVGESLATLVGHAGFTSRPSLNELAMQYRVLGSAPKEQVTTANLRLLASRTYSALAAELETTRFTL